MSERNSIDLAAAARFGKIRGSAGGSAARAIAFIASGAVSLMVEPTATANYAVAVVFGGKEGAGGA